jgi:hypothetical protein
MFKTYRTCIFFPTSILRERAIETGTASANPTYARAPVSQSGIQVGQNNLLFRSPGFAEDSTVGIQDHGVSRSDFIIVWTHTVCEDEKKTVVMGSSW